MVSIKIEQPTVCKPNTPTAKTGMCPKTHTKKHVSPYLKHTPSWPKNMQAYCLPNQTHPLVDPLCIPKILTKTTRAPTHFTHHHCPRARKPTACPTREPDQYTYEES